MAREASLTGTAEQAVKEKGSIFDAYATRVSNFIIEHGGTNYIRGNYNTDVVKSTNIYSDIVGEMQINLITNSVPLFVDIVLRFDFYDVVQEYAQKDEAIVDRVIIYTLMRIRHALGRSISSLATGEFPFTVFFEIEVHGATTDEEKLNDWREHAFIIESRQQIIKSWAVFPETIEIKPPHSPIESDETVKGENDPAADSE